MASTLVTCPSCSVPIRARESVCPNCGARRGAVVAAPAGAMIVLGMMLTGCPADDSTTETMGGSATDSTATDSASTNGMSMSGGSASQSSTSVSTTDDVGTTTAQPPYGVPETSDTVTPETDGSTSGSDTGTDTGTGTSSGGEQESEDEGPRLDLPPD